MDNTQNEELQSRREFFKKAAKAALPVVGGIVLTNFPMRLFSQQGGQVNIDYIPNPYATSCGSNCSNGCYGTCRDSCFSTCQGNCKGDCTGSSRGQVTNRQSSNSCYSGCTNSCAGACTGNCYRSCSSGCDGSCTSYAYY